MSTKSNSTLLLGAAGLAALAVWYASNDKNKSASNSAGNKHSFTGNADYIRKMAPYAIATQKLTKVPADVNLLISAVESGFGKHAINNNYHGIKADRSWHGDFSLVKTPECSPTGNTNSFHAEVLSVVPPHGSGDFAACSNKGDYTVWINDKFRKYSTPAASFLDFAHFLQTQSRYKPAFDYTDDSKEFGKYILLHGYSTAQYVDTFLSLLGMIQKQMK